MAVNTGLKTFRTRFLRILLQNWETMFHVIRRRDSFSQSEKCDSRSKKYQEYPDSYTDEQIAKDMFRYYSNIRRLALYDYNQIGVEGQVSHSETGESRSWADRGDCLKGVYAVATVI